MYIPLKYTLKAKYSKWYGLDQLLLVDIVMPVVATSYDFSSLMAHSICLPFFVLSLMCIYEIGYVENDLKAARSEVAPVVTIESQDFHSYRMEPVASLFSLIFALTGLLIGAGIELFSLEEVLNKLLIWLCVLISCRVVFYIYNTRPVDRRNGLYFILQLIKYGGVLLIITPTLAGSILTASQAFTMSIVYWVYRLGGRQKAINRESMRFTLACGILLFLLLGGMMENLFSNIGIIFCAIWLILRQAKPPLMKWLRDV